MLAARFNFFAKRFGRLKKNIYFCSVKEVEHRKQDIMTTHTKLKV